MISIFDRRRSGVDFILALPLAVDIHHTQAVREARRDLLVEKRAPLALRSHPAPDDPQAPGRNKVLYRPSPWFVPDEQHRPKASAPTAGSRMVAGTCAQPASVIASVQDQQNSTTCAWFYRDRRAWLLIGAINATYFSISTPRQNATKPLILRAAGLGSG